ncbi:MAG: DnaB-like helicase C-terminal domain-containing protein [Elusimicrobiota bacterium]
MNSETKQIEQAVIGCLILDCKLMEKAQYILSTCDFHYNQTRALYSYILELNKSGGFDETILKSARTDAELWNSITECIEAVKTTVDIFDDYVRMLKKAVKVRKLKVKIQELHQQIQDIRPIDSSVNDFIQQAIKDLTDIICDSNTTNDFNLKEELDKVVDYLYEQKEGSTELATGFVDIDELIGGIFRQELFVVGAPPGHGKTSFLLSLAYNLIMRNKKVLFVSLEMYKRELFLRLLSMKTKVPHKYLRLPKFLSKQDYSKILSQVGMLWEKPLIVLDGDYFINDIAVAAQKYKPDVLMVDFIQHIKFTDKELERFALSLSFTARELKMIAKKNNIAVVVASQLNREIYKRPNRIPQSSDLKSSGGIEENADTVGMLFWKWQHYPDKNPDTKLPWLEEEKKVLNFIITKNRHGVTGGIKLFFDYTCTQIENLQKFGVAK